MPLPLTLFNRLLRPHLNDNGLQFSVPNGLKVKNLFMLSVRISSYGCTRKVWRARKILKTHKKSKQTSLLAGQKHATFYTLVCVGTFDPVNR